MADSEIRSITVGTDLAGVDEIVVEYSDGGRRAFPGSFAEARDLARRAGLEAMEPLARRVTRWYRRTT